MEKNNKEKDINQKIIKNNKINDKNQNKKINNIKQKLLNDDMKNMDTHKNEKNFNTKSNNYNENNINNENIVYLNSTNNFSNFNNSIKKDDNLYNNILNHNKNIGNDNFNQNNSNKIINNNNLVNSTNILANIESKNNNRINIKNNNNISQINNYSNLTKISNYLFSTKGLRNIGSTCYMNATLQCLLHVYELIAYFLEEYPNDFSMLKKKNKDIESNGEISKAFYNLVKGVYNKSYNDNNKGSINAKTYIANRFVSDLGAFSPYEFKRILGIYNSQFSSFEANDSKDLILYLFQTIHEELNYCGDNNSFPMVKQPNQLDKVNTYNYFIYTYNICITKFFTMIAKILIIPF